MAERDRLREPEVGDEQRPGRSSAGPRAAAASRASGCVSSRRLRLRLVDLVVPWLPGDVADRCRPGPARRRLVARLALVGWPGRGGVRVRVAVQELSRRNFACRSRPAGPLAGAAAGPTSLLTALAGDDRVGAQERADRVALRERAAEVAEEQATGSCSRSARASTNAIDRVEQVRGLGQPLQRGQDARVADERVERVERLDHARVELRRDLQRRRAGLERRGEVRRGGGELPERRLQAAEQLGRVLLEAGLRGQLLGRDVERLRAAERDALLQRPAVVGERGEGVVEVRRTARPGSSATGATSAAAAAERREQLVEAACARRAGCRAPGSPCLTSGSRLRSAVLMSPPRPAKPVPYSSRLSAEPSRVCSSNMLKNWSMSTAGAWRLGHGDRAAAGDLPRRVPRVIATYLRPSDDFGRTFTTVSTGRCWRVGVERQLERGGGRAVAAGERVDLA